MAFDSYYFIDDNPTWTPIEISTSAQQEFILGRLTTHVLDTAAGKPAKDMKISLYLLENDQRQLLKETTTNDDGRCAEPLLDGPALKTGTYELVFQVSRYFAAYPAVSNPPFLGDVPIRFAIADLKAHYHVPLLVSPWSYSTYRGS